MKLRKLSDLLWTIAPNLYFLGLVAGIISGFAYGLLIPLIMYGVKSVVETREEWPSDTYSILNSPTESVATFYFIACLLILLLRTISTTLSTYIASKAQVKLREIMCKTVDNMSYRELMELGQSRLINLINIDVPAIINSAMVIPVIWISVLTIFGTLAYLVYLDLKVFVFVISVLIVAMITYQIPLIWCFKFMAKARQSDDVFQEGVKGIVYGVKELKLNREKAHRFMYEEIQQPNQRAFMDRVKGYTLWGVAENYGTMIAFFVIAVAVFHLPYRFDFTVNEIFGIALALIYLTGPVGAVLNGMGQLPNGNVALKNIQEFLNKAGREQYGSSSLPRFANIKAVDIGFNYSSSDKLFVLNEVSAEFKEGQITFLVGGNGSGKSTFAKILTLHQQPDTGSLYFGEEKVSDANMLSARSFISSIYLDYYLFPNFYMQYDEELANHYLHMLKLNDKVKIVNGKLSTISLSDGQRKRLALFFLLLEDRKVCLLDEWAADQDPEFKKIYYEKILLDLKNKNKIVIVISHDREYFNVADQIIYMESGKIKNVDDLGSV